MTVLADEQYETGGYLFGAGCRTWVMSDGDVTGEVTQRTQDTPHPQKDLILMGRDYLNAPTREFVVAVEADDAATELAAFIAACRADGVRATPLASSTLRWRRHGHTYWAPGRWRELEPLHRQPIEPKRRYARAVWQYRDAMAYADSLERVDLDLIAEPLGTGLVLPAVLPWTLGRVTRARDGVATVAGGAAVPFGVAVYGPSVGAASAIKLWGPGWLLDFGSLSLGPGQILRVDTSGVGSAVVGSVSVASLLSRTSTLTGRLHPGTAEFRFQATDSSATAHAVIFWRPAALVF